MKKKLVVACAGLLTSSLSGYGQAIKKPSAVHRTTPGQDAVDLAQKGHCDQALPLLRKSISITQDKDLKRRIGTEGVRCSMILEQTDRAVDFLRELEHAFPHDPEVLYLAVHTHSDLSMRASHELAAVAPRSNPARQLTAESFEVQGRWDDAEKEYREILEENPQTPGIHYRIGRIILSKPETATTGEDARKEFEAELEVNPQNAGAEYVLGELARQNEQMDVAIDHFTRATRLDEGFADAFVALGMCLVGEKRYSDAIPPLETAAKLQAGNPSTHYNLAIAYSRVGRLEDAKRESELRKAALDKIELENKRAAEASQRGTSSGSPERTPPH